MLRHSTPAANATGSLAQPNVNSGPEMLADATCNCEMCWFCARIEIWLMQFWLSRLAPKTLQVPLAASRVKLDREMLPNWTYEFRVRANM